MIGVAGPGSSVRRVEQAFVAEIALSRRGFHVARGNQFRHEHLEYISHLTRSLRKFGLQYIMPQSGSNTVHFSYDVQSLGRHLGK